MKTSDHPAASKDAATHYLLARGWTGAGAVILKVASDLAVERPEPASAPPAKLRRRAIKAIDTLLAVLPSVPARVEPETALLPRRSQLTWLRYRLEKADAAAKLARKALADKRTRFAVATLRGTIKGARHYGQQIRRLDPLELLAVAILSDVEQPAKNEGRQARLAEMWKKRHARALRIAQRFIALEAAQAPGPQLENEAAILKPRGDT